MKKMVLIFCKKDLKMFKKMTRRDRQIEPLEAFEILKNNDYGVLSTICENGYAYGVPLNYIYLNDSIYFHGAPGGLKLDNIKANNKVSFCVVGDTMLLSNNFHTNYESVIVFGKATEVFDDEKREMISAFINKFSKGKVDKWKEYMEMMIDKTNVIKISIENINAKSLAPRHIL